MKVNDFSSCTFFRSRVVGFLIFYLSLSDFFPSTNMLIRIRNAKTKNKRLECHLSFLTSVFDIDYQTEKEEERRVLWFFTSNFFFQGLKIWAIRKNFKLLFNSFKSINNKYYFSVPSNIKMFLFLDFFTIIKLQPSYLW